MLHSKTHRVNAMTALDKSSLLLGTSKVLLVASAIPYLFNIVYWAAINTESVLAGIYLLLMFEVVRRPVNLALVKPQRIPTWILCATASALFIYFRIKSDASTFGWDNPVTAMENIIVIPCFGFLAWSSFRADKGST